MNFGNEGTLSITATLDDQQAFHDRIDFLRDVLQRWVARPDTVLACGRWSEGAIGEFNPVGRGKVLSARYKDCFAGVCDIRLEGQPHHLHVDLGRVYAVRYCLSPSVCFGFKPSLEVRFMLAVWVDRPVNAGRSRRWWKTLISTAVLTKPA